MMKLRVRFWSMERAVRSLSAAWVAKSGPVLGVFRQRDVVAGLAGLAVGAVTVFSIGVVTLEVASVVLFVAALTASALTKRFTSVVTASLVLWAFSAVITPRLAPPTDWGEAPYAGVADMLRGALVVGGWLLAAFAHACGILFRFPGDKPNARRFVIAAGLVSAIVLIATLIVVPPLPATSSFVMSPPAGWTTRVSTTDGTETWDYPPDYCRNYAATLGTDDPFAPASNVLENASHTLALPTACVAVVKGWPDDSQNGDDEPGIACYHGLDTHWAYHPMYQWTTRETPSSPPIAGAHEEIRVGPQGDTIYGLGIDRVRSVGPILERVCYIVSLTAATSGRPNTFIDVLAYLPPTAPFAMPTLVGLGTATWWEFGISVALSIASTIAVARIATSVYRRAILRTGRRVRIRELRSAKPSAAPRT